MVFPQLVLKRLRNHAKPVDTLKSFKDSGLKGGIAAKLDFESREAMIIEFSWNPDWDLKSSGKIGQASLSRKDKIWESTCFEAFIKPKNGNSYYEINLALDGRWNIYRFDSIREPQPPKSEENWKVRSLEISEGRLKCVVQTKLEPVAYQIGLSAIIETSKGEKSYWALKHCKSKPDFHDYDAFTIERKLK